MQSPVFRLRYKLSRQHVALIFVGRFLKPHAGAKLREAFVQAQSSLDSLADFAHLIISQQGGKAIDGIKRIKTEGVLWLWITQTSCTLLNIGKVANIVYRNNRKVAKI